jgi:tRNA(Arg) A34 adenosine deaminase TadA
MFSCEIARKSRSRGDNPFGAVLVDEDGNIVMEAEDTVPTERDCTGHAETNLMRKASAKYDREFLGKCTTYTSAEPCPMCTGAVYWAHVMRVVYGLNEEVFERDKNRSRFSGLSWKMRLARCTWVIGDRTPPGAACCQLDSVVSSCLGGAPCKP